MMFNVLEPPFSVPPFRSTSPDTVWVRPFPRFSVPFDPSMTNPPQFTLPVKVADPPVLDKLVVPVMV